MNNNNLNNKNKNDLDGKNYYDIKEVECPRCSEIYEISPNKRFYYCNDCQNLMCGKCSKGHYLQHPDHKCSKADLEKPEAREYILGLPGKNKNNLNDLNNNNQNINDNNLNGNKDPNRRKMNLNKYINKNNNLVNNHASDPNSISKLEDNNRGRLRSRPNDSENLNKNNSYNIPGNAQMNDGTFNTGVVDDYNCNYCGKTQKNNPNNNFYICRDCDNLLCNQCKDKHEPKHNLLALYNSGEKDRNNSNVDPKLINQYYKNNNNENIPSDNNFTNTNNENRNNNVNDNNNRGWLRNRPNDNKNLNKNTLYNAPDNQNKVGEFNTGTLDNNNCNYCGKNQRNNPNENFYICRDCNNNLLCNKCKDEHEPRHNLFALYNSGEMDKNNSNVDPKLIYQYYKNNSNENIPSNLNNINNNNINDNNNREWLRNKQNANKNISYNIPDNQNKGGEFNTGYIDNDNCNYCGKNKRNNPNESFYICRDCNNNLLCNKCKDEHEPKHNLLALYNSGEMDKNNSNVDPKLIYQYYKNNNNENIPSNLNNINNNRGWLRNKQNGNKNISYNIPDNQNKVGEFNTGTLDNENCNYCGKNQRNNPNENFYICRDCNNNLLCNKCKDEHDPKHNLINYYYKNSSNENIPNNLNNINNNENDIYKNNNNYNINDNNNRGWLRNKQNGNKNNSYNIPDNQNKIGEFNTGTLDNENCNYCGKNQRNNPNERFYICKDCNNNLLCNKCKDEHEPKHNLLALYNSGEMDKNNPNIDPKLIYQYYKNNSNENIPSNLNNNKNNANIYNINDNQNNNAQLYNTNANNKEWQRYKPNDNSQMKSVEPNSRILNSDCYMCGINQKDYPYERFHLCRNCNYLLCNQCKDTHYNKYPKHFILALYNSANDEPRKAESQGSINNSPSKNRNRNYNDNLDNYQTQYQMNKNRNNVDNISNLNRIDVQNNKNKYDNNLNQIDPNNNTNNSYSTKESNIDNRNLSPNKRIALRKYNNRYNDQDEDNYNDMGVNQESQNGINNQNLRNNNNNLAKSRKCKIEFDLNKQDSEFNKCEIFDFPACSYCLKKKKKKKTIQIFYCSQCMKLFCRDCLYLHNYCS